MVHWAETHTSKDSANAATAATMVNANVVNARSMWLKLPVSWQKNAVWGRFLASKNTVNYSANFFVNTGTVHFTARHPPQ
jgi:hypothetical protein